MGLPLALRLRETGHDVVAHNRTPQKLAPIQAAGGVTVDSPAAVLAASEATILMLSDAAAIAQTLLTPATQPHLKGHTIIQMGTIAPDESRDLCAQVEAAGGQYLEAPVLGSIPQAQTGTLILMVGATPEQFQHWQPLWQIFGEAVFHLGPVGAGAATKLAMNQLIGSLTHAFALSLALVQREGIDVDAFMEIVRGSALYAPTFDKKLGRMRDRNFENPNFPTKHLRKDMALFCRAAEQAGLDPALALAVVQLSDRAIAAGAGDQDYSAIYAAVNPAGAD